MVETTKRFKGFAVTDADKPLIQSMKPEYQAVLAESGKYEDIAKRLGVKVGTVKSRTHRARTALVAKREDAACAS